MERAQIPPQFACSSPVHCLLEEVLVGEEVAAGEVVRAPENVAMSVSPTVLETPSAEIAVTTAAGESEAVRKVAEGLATARAFVDEDVVDDVQPSLVHASLFLTFHRHDMHQATHHINARKRVGVLTSSIWTSL